MAETTYILLSEEKEIFRHVDEEEVYKHLQKVQPQSMSYATTYGGYKVIWWMDDFKAIGATQESRTVVNNFGDTRHNHATAAIVSVDAPADSGLDKITTIKCECGFDALDELRHKKVEDGENTSSSSE